MSLLLPELLLLATLWPVAWWWHRRRGVEEHGFAPGWELPRTLRARLAGVPRWLFGLALLSAALAAARPVTVREVPVVQPGSDILLVLDVSSSMRAHDLDPGRDRLAVVREAAGAFVAARPQDRIGLLRFARYPDLLCPPTRDHAALQARLALLEPVAEDGAEDATGIGTAVARAVELLDSGAQQQADGLMPARVVVLLTDGEENVAAGGVRGEIAPVHAAQFAAQLGVRVHAIAAGRGRPAPGGGQVPLDTSALEDLAERSGGAFFQAPDAAALAEVYARIDALESPPQPDPRLEVREHARWFAGSALLLAVLGGLLAATYWSVRPDRGRRLRSVCVLTAAVAALIAFVSSPRSAGIAAQAADGVDGGPAWIYALDLSRSMAARDSSPSRLGRAQADLHAAVAAAGGARVGLVGFAGDAELRVPLTADRASFGALLADLEVGATARGGTDLAAALRTAAAALAGAEVEGGTIVLLSDGEDHGGAGAAAARELEARGITVHAVGYGSAAGARIPVASAAGGEEYLRGPDGAEVVTRLQPDGLRALAAAGGGRFVQADAAAAVATLLTPSAADPPAAGRPAGALFLTSLLLAMLALAAALAVPFARSHSALLPRWNTVPAAWFLVVALGGGCGDAASEHHRDAQHAVAERDWRAAAAALRAAAAGSPAVDQLFWRDFAVVALRAGELDDAELAALEVELRPSTLLPQSHDVAAEALNVLGAVSFRRAQLAEELALPADAPPQAYAQPLADYRRAQEYWSRGLVALPALGGRPVLARNLERAVRAEERLLRRQEEARARAAEEPPPTPEPGGAEEPAAGEAVPELTELPWERGVLDVEGLAALRLRLREKEAERRALRAQVRGEQTAAGERAW